MNAECCEPCAYIESIGMYSVFCACCVSDIFLLSGIRTGPTDILMIGPWMQWSHRCHHGWAIDSLVPLASSWLGHGCSRMSSCLGHGNSGPTDLIMIMVCSCCCGAKGCTATTDVIIAGPWKHCNYLRFRHSKLRKRRRPQTVST